MKLKIILPLLGLAIASVWAGSTYIISEQSEAVLEQQLTQTQTLFEQQLLPFKWEKTSYTGGFNAAEATTKISFRDLSGESDELILLHLKHQIQHGPVYLPTNINQADAASTDSPQQLSLGFGASRWITTIDTEQLPDESKALLQQGFGDIAPLLLVSNVAANGDVKINAQLARFAISNAYANNNTNILIDSSQLHSTLIDGRLMGNTLLELGQVKVDSPTSQINIPASELNMHITDYLGPMALGRSDWQIDDVQIQAGGSDIRFSAGMTSISEVKDGLFNADGLLSLSKLDSPLPVNEASMKVQYSGFNAEGLARLSNIWLDLQQVVGKLMQSDEAIAAANNYRNGGEPITQTSVMNKAMEALKAQHPELEDELDQAIAQSLVPGKSRIGLKLATKTGEQSSFADVSIQYAADAPAFSLSDFVNNKPGSASGPNPLLQLLDSKLDLSLESSLFGQALFQAFMPGLVQQGIFTEASHNNSQGQDQSSFDLNATLNKGVLMLNGIEMPLPAIPGL